MNSKEILVQKEGQCLVVEWWGVRVGEELGGQMDGKSHEQTETHPLASE